MVIAIFISLLMQFDQLAWTVITILILSMPEVGTTWVKAVHRLFGTFIGATGGLAMIAMFPESPNMVLIVFSLVLFLGLYLSMTMITSMYTYFMVVVTMIIVSTSAWDDPLGVQELALERFQNTALGVLCVTFGATVLWPVRAEDQLVDSMVARIRTSRDRIQWILTSIEEGKASAMPLLDYNPLAKQLTLFQSASMESHVVSRHRATVMVLLTIVDRLSSLGAEIDRESAHIAFEDLGPECRRLTIELLELLDEVLSKIELSRERHAAQLSPELLDLVERKSIQLDDVRSSIKDPALLSLTASVVRMGRMAEHLGVLDQWCGGTLIDTSYLNGEIPLGDARLIHSPFSTFEKVDVLAMHTAIKGSLAAVIALLVVASMRWNEAGATAVVTCVLVILPTIGGSVSKSLQRLIGAFFGAVCGIATLAALAPNTYDVGILLLLVGMIGFIAQWIMLGRWQVSYAGMQFAFAFAITSLAYNEPTSDINSGIDRVFGILVGLVVSMLVLWLVWPVRASNRLLFSLGESARLMGRFLQRGLLTVEQEREQRPLNGFRYRIAWLLSDSYRLREEARFEQKMSPTVGAPALELGVLLQSLNLSVHAVVQNRLEHDQVIAFGKLDAVHRLLASIHDRLEAIGDLVEHGTPLPPSPLDAMLAEARTVVDSITDLDEADLVLVRTQVGYYTEVVNLLPEIEQEGARCHAIFSGKPGAG